MRVLSWALACALVAPFVPQPAHAVKNPVVVYTDPGEIPRLRIATSDAVLPLEHTDVKAEVTGFVARVEVRQTYSNPSKDPLEAIYIFPLPENSAVDDMRMKIGDREIRAEIKKREEARQTYEAARNEGHTAALLEQERPNVFTQSVANIAPGARIEVVVSYVQTLTYDAGQYEFVFPMVVGPRYIPGGNKVPDAARITPTYMGEGERNGHDIAVDVVVHPGFPITSYDVPTHETIGETLADGGLHIKLSSHDKLPNRDFVFHYSVAGAQPQVTLLTHGDGNDGEFALIVQPPALDIDRIVGKREIIFVVDVSGSMHGVPLAMCKDAMREALRKLRPMDTFNVLVFASNTGQAFSEPRPANDANVLDGLKYVDGLTAGGGTEMADAVAAALSPSSDKERHRYVFFMTDGYVGNETEIIAKAAHLVESQKQTGARARVFGFGVGSSVNRMLIDGLGKSGEGAAVYATTREDPALAVNTFFRIIDAPVIEDLKIDWGTAKVSEVYPAQLPDLFASRPTIIHGRFSGKADTTITVKGTANGKPLSVSTKASFSKADDNKALDSLWARAKVESLERDLWNGPDQKVIEAITQVGLDHRLVTAYTSFVAVDTSTKVDGKLHTVNQPVYGPEGVDLEMAGGEMAKVHQAPRRFQGGPVPYPAAPPASGYAGSMGGKGRGDSSGLAERATKTPSSTVLSVDAPKPEPLQKQARKEEKVKDAREVAPETLVVGAGLDQSAVRSTLAASKAQIDAVLAKAGFTGALHLRWFVTAQGTVIQCKVTEGKLDAESVKQLVAIITALKFPAAAQGSARVDYTLTR